MTTIDTPNNSDDAEHAGARCAGARRQLPDLDSSGLPSPGSSPLTTSASGVMYLVSVLARLVPDRWSSSRMIWCRTRTDRLPKRDDHRSRSPTTMFFTLHGAVMVFLVIIPSIPASLGNFVLPIMLGAKDVAFPTPEPLLLFHLWIIGAIFVVLSLLLQVVSTPDGRSTRRIPRTTDSAMGGVVPVPLRQSSSSASASIFTGTELRRHRSIKPASAGHDLVPDAALPLGDLLRPQLIQILATPVLAITLMLVGIERAFQHRHLRPCDGWGSGALPALLLVLLAPRGLHHDPACHGHHQ